MMQHDRAGGVIPPALLVLGAVLASFAFPNDLVREGLWPLAWLALIPVALFLRGRRILTAALGGMVYGALLVLLGMYWLGTYHPVALSMAVMVNVLWFGIIFSALGAIHRHLPRASLILGPLAWVGGEYFRTLGFLGQPYLIMGYSQYMVEPLLPLASLGGIWLVGLPIALVGWLGAAVTARHVRGLAAHAPHGADIRLMSIMTAAVLALGLTFGFLAMADDGPSGTVPADAAIRMALVQHNVDPWKGGTAAYRKNLDILKRLSDTALKDDPDLLVWSETAFVPAIAWHLRYREDREREALVRDLVDWLAGLPIPVLLGQNHAERVQQGEGWRRDDYNSTLLWDRGGFVERYDKMHLVPFSEYFPYGDILPWFLEWLKANDTHLWTPGTRPVVFRAAGTAFSTPICFEDSFGYLGRNFVNGGARVFVTVSNDSWSGSVTAMMQHLSMAVFRSAETGVPMVRASNGGMTVHIDARGRILSMLEPFSEGVLIADVVPAKDPSTLYLAWGDWFGQACLAIAAASLMAALGLALARRLNTMAGGSPPMVDSTGKKAQYREKR